MVCYLFAKAVLCMSENPGGGGETRHSRKPVHHFAMLPKEDGVCPLLGDAALLTIRCLDLSNAKWTSKKVIYAVPRDVLDYRVLSLSKSDSLRRKGT